MEFVAIRIELNVTIVTCTTDVNIDKIFNNFCHLTPQSVSISPSVLCTHILEPLDRFW
jgi:hypothetical protein